MFVTSTENASSDSYNSEDSNQTSLPKGGRLSIRPEQLHLKSQRMHQQCQSPKNTDMKEDLFTEEGLFSDSETKYSKLLTAANSDNGPIEIKKESEERKIKEEPLYDHYIKTEFPGINEEDCPKEPNIDSKYEPSSGPGIDARLEESKKLLIQRKTDIQMMIGQSAGPFFYTCSLCPYQNSKKKNVDKHALIHNKFKEFKCDLCSYECHWKSWMIRHKQKHQLQPHEYKCDQCNYKARFKVCLERHLMNHAKLKPFACHLCSYRGNSKGYLRSHMTIHSKIKPYACPKCDYSCTRKKYLFLHLKSHSLSKLRRPRVPFSAKSVSGGFQCTICDYQCMRKSTLQTHLKRHYSQTEFPCDLCSYKTNRKDLLDSHKLTHSTFKKFQCAHCEFKSHWSHCLRRHMFVKHLNFRPFKCAECEYTTADKSNLKKHVQSHLEVLYCRECDMEFKTRSNLTRHKNKFHRSQGLLPEESEEVLNGFKELAPSDDEETLNAF